MPAHSGKTPGPSTCDITGLLLVWGRGDDKALEDLIPLVYEELRRLAGRADALVMELIRGERLLAADRGWAPDPTEPPCGL